MVRTIFIVRTIFHGYRYRLNNFLAQLVRLPHKRGSMEFFTNPLPAQTPVLASKIGYRSTQALLSYHSVPYSS